VALSGARLYGVALLSREGAGTIAPEVTVLRLRDLGALVRSAPYTRGECTAHDVDGYHQVIDAAFRLGAVLPAPCGTVFRSMEQVRRWLAQNYIALSEGIHFVAGRCGARVHISARGRDRAPTADGLAALAAECARELRGTAVASVAIRRDAQTDMWSSAYLLEQERWHEFVEQVRDLAERHDVLAFEQSGPWPPYDFVRMDLGA
jgi:hypothetical protein